MTELEWKLSKANTQLRIQLAQVQSQVCQLLHDAAMKENSTLGEAWNGPENGAGQALGDEPIDTKAH